jgi:hypothetical protein
MSFNTSYPFMVMFCFHFLCDGFLSESPVVVVGILYCFSFCLTWKVFILPSILNDTFTGQSILGLKLLSFSAQNASLPALLSFKFSVDKSIILICLPLCTFCFFLSYSLQYSFFILCASCFNDNIMFCSCLFGVLETSCT